VATVLLSAPPPSVAAQAPAGQDDAPAVVDVVEVDGRIDPVVADFLTRSVDAAEKAGSEVLVIQLDSPGVLVGRERFTTLVERIRTARMPVVVWVGPSGARAGGAAVALLAGAATAGMAPGSRVAGLRPEEAQARGLVETVDPTLGEFVVNLDGREVGGTTLRTARVVPEGDLLRRQQAGQVRFAKLGLTERLLHLTARPSVAYLLLVVGLLLIVFEFFTAGVGVAGVTGAVSLILSAYGLAVLPTDVLGLALVSVGILGFAIDVQAGAPRAWTGIGTVCFLLGSWRLFPGDLRVPLVVIALLAASVALFMLSGMTAMLRARFSTPTIGRESMIGEMGEATTGIDPEGMVDLRGGAWRARTNRATPIPAGERVRVVAIDGLLLEVEPETGGAKDTHH
jgi:membrane-bound serine protease (ClpP class)